MWAADWHDVIDSSTSLQTVLLAMSCQTSAEVVVNVDKAENDKDVECCEEQNQTFS